MWQLQGQGARGASRFADPGTYPNPCPPTPVEWELRQKYTVAAVGTEKVRSYLSPPCCFPSLPDLRLNSRAPRLLRPQTIHSLVRVELDGSGKVVRFEDRWNNKPLPSGPVASALRLANAKSVPWLVSYPKNVE